MRLLSSIYLSSPLFEATIISPDEQEQKKIALPLDKILGATSSKDGKLLIFTHPSELGLIVEGTFEEYLNLLEAYPNKPLTELQDGNELPF